MQLNMLIICKSYVNFVSRTIIRRTILIQDLRHCCRERFLDKAVPPNISVPWGCSTCTIMQDWQKGVRSLTKTRNVSIAGTRIVGWGGGGEVRRASKFSQPNLRISLAFKDSFHAHKQFFLLLFFFIKLASNKVFLKYHETYQMEYS